MFHRRQTLFFLIFISAIFSSYRCKAQKEGDSKIIVTVSNPENVYVRLKDILIRANFYVKDLSIRDSIITYPTDFNGVYVIGIASIKGNTVTLSGTYGLKKINDWGYTVSPKSYEKIIYYKGNREWRILRDIATLLGGDIVYER